ncbi:ABC transporter permease [Lacticaseibacillus porcinae]|uniref:ABC transporter permease n=1 Tax=Lacticaseibacillus porcinae TaxID=1123687 RepID=UPI000F773E8B|nr:FtsX-like permease family protein [Lacticaseibacillus porcinae]
MFLALKEMRKEKLRYSLIIAMIVLISYLIFILTSLALGLAQQNTDAINSWGMQSIIMNKDADISLSQSLIQKSQAPKTLPKSQAYIAQAPIVAKKSGHDQVSGTFIGLDNSQFVAKNITLTSGHLAKSRYQLVVDDAFKESGYKLGDTFKLNGNDHAYKIVGFTHNAKMSVAPVVYGRLSAWATLKNVPTTMIASAIVSTKTTPKAGNSALHTYDKNAFVQKLPGYSAQNMTFEMMIGFLMVISLIVIAVFLYILTMQKQQNYAVLRAQGIPGSVLVKSTLSQAFLMVISGLVIGVILTVATAMAMPSAVPMAFDVPILGAVALALVIIAMLGAVIPVRSILKVDPVSVIGG